MSFEACLSKAKQYLEEAGLSRNIRGDRLEYLAKQLDRVAGDSLTPAEFAAKAQDFLENDYKRETAARKAINAQNMYLRELNARNVLSNKAAWQADIASGKKDFDLFGAFGTNDPNRMATEAVRVWQEGGALRLGADTNSSPALMKTAVQSKLWKNFRQALGDLEPIVANEKPVLDRNMILELSAMDNHMPLGQTNDPNALEYAKAFKAARDKVFSMEQSRNPLLMKADNYLMHQLYDRERVSAVSKEDFVSKMQSRAGKTFSVQGDEGRAGLFGGMYDKIVAGKWGSTLDEWDPSQKGSIYRRQAASRTVQFNSAADFADHNAEFGPKTLYDGMRRMINQSAGDIAMLMKAGPTPDLMREQLISKVQNSLDGEELAQFKRDRPMLDRKWEVVKGAQNAPAIGRGAQITKGLMTAQWLAKGGTAIIHAGPGDLTLGASLLRDLDGSSLPSHAVDIAAQFTKSVSDAKFKENAQMKLGLYAKAAAREFAADFGTPDENPGAAARAASAMGTLSGYTGYVDNMQVAEGTVLTSMLGDHSTLLHSDLPKSWQQGLARYGIDENKWNVMRLARETWDGDTHLTPEGIENLPDEAVENYLRKSGQWTSDKNPSQAALTKARDDMSIQLATMVNEHASLGTAHTDTRQRSFMYGDTNINDGMGQLRRMFWQFKAATQVSADVARRGILSGQTPGGAYAGLASRMAMMAFFTAISDAAYQAAKGKTPEDPRSAAYVAKLAVGSGFAGVYGSVLEDALWQSHGADDKMKSVMQQTLGPVPSMVAGAVGLAGQAVQDATGGSRGPSKLGSDAAKFALSNAPIGVNSLVWTKAAFDFYVGNALREFAGPGYLHALERSAEMHGQHYMFAAPTGDSFLKGDQ